MQLEFYTSVICGYLQSLITDNEIFMAATCHSCYKCFINIYNFYTSYNNMSVNW